MKILVTILLCFILNSCASKNSLDFNKKNSLYKIDKNVNIFSIKKTKESAFSFSIGILSSISNHVNLRTSGMYRPKIVNKNALKLENKIHLYNIDLNNLIINEINKQLSKKISKNAFTHIITLSLLSYDFDSRIFSNKYQVKLKMKILIKDLNNREVYINKVEYKYNSDNNSYTKERILKNKKNLIESFSKSLQLTIEELINNI